MTEARRLNLDTAAWPVIHATPAMTDEAHEVRSSRWYSGGRTYSKTEKRWLGELGAIAVGRWFQECGILDAHWMRRTSPYEVDYDLGLPIRVRTSARASFSPEDCIGLNERHRKHEPYTQYIFTVVNPEATRVTIVGAMMLDDFWALAKPQTDAELVRAGKPSGGTLYDLPIKFMTPPVRWLCDAIPQLPRCFTQQTMGFDVPVVQRREHVDRWTR